MNDIQNNFFLILNALLWIITFVYILRKKRYWGLGVSILLFYATISVIDIHLFNSTQAKGEFEMLKLFPFLYLYAMILLAIYPILQIHERNLNAIQSPNESIFKSVSIILIIFSLYGIWDIISNIPKGLIMLMIDDDFPKEAYKDGLESLDRSKSNSGFNIISIACNAARAVVPAFMLYYITRPNTNKILLTGLIVSSFIAPLQAIVNGSRYEPAVFIVNLFFGFIFIRKFVSKKIRVKFNIIGLFTVTLICIPFLFVTLSRTDGDTDRMIYSIERYSAESFLNFNNYGLNANGFRYGDKTVPVLKELCGMETARNYMERRNKYWMMNMDESVFYTFVGDFTLDFGPFITAILFIFNAIFFCTALKIRKQRMLFHQYLLLYLLMYGCVGYFQFPLADINGNMRIILMLFLYFLFKMEYNIHKYYYK